MKSTERNLRISRSRFASFFALCAFAVDYVRSAIHCTSIGSISAPNKLRVAKRPENWFLYRRTAAQSYCNVASATIDAYRADRFQLIASTLHGV